MENKVIIASVTNSGDWFEATLNDGRKVSVWTGTKDGKTSNPLLKEALSKATPGSEIEMKIVPKGDKNYGWEVQANNNGKGKTYLPQDKGLSTYLSCLNSTCLLFSHQQSLSAQVITQTAEFFYVEAMKHSTLKQS